MGKTLRKIVLLALLLLCLSTYFLTWVNYAGIQVIDGAYILTGHVLLSGLIIGMYSISVIFLEKAPKVFFCMGLSSLSMLFAVTFFEFEKRGRFTNRCIGPYASLISILGTLAIYLILTVRSQKDPVPMGHDESDRP